MDLYQTTTIDLDVKISDFFILNSMNRIEKVPDENKLIMQGEIEECLAKSLHIDTKISKFK